MLEVFRYYGSKLYLCFQIEPLIEVILSRENEQIDSYKLLYFLGSGGSSDVYAGKGPWERDVAIKLQTAANKRKRFVHEFEILNLIQHPLLTPIYAFGIQKNGDAYLVMELIEGLYASRYTQELVGQRKIVNAIQITATIANALGHLHQQGWIHGDIKAKNILVSKMGIPYIIDFELSRHITETGKGKFFGTRSYSPPEQHEGSYLNPSVDVYALASLLCRMISGKLPYPKMDNSEQVKYRRSNKATVPDKIPKALKELLIQSLHHDPTFRPKNGFEFSKLLLDVLPQKDRHLKLPIEEDIGLSKLIPLLREHNFAIGTHLRELHFLSGGSTIYAKEICEWWTTNSLSFPPALFEQIQLRFRGMPKSLRMAISIAAVLGGCAPLSFILKVTNGRKDRLKKYISNASDWLKVGSGMLYIRLGLLISIAPEEADRHTIERFLKIWTGRKGLLITKGFLMIRNGEIDACANLLSEWIQRSVNTQKQWLLLRKIQTTRVDLEWETQILSCRWNGDWKAALRLYSDQDSNFILKFVSTGMGDFKSNESKLVKLTESNIPDIRVGACALLSEWYIANGHFSKSLPLLQKLCNDDDVYTLQEGLKQRALLHHYLGQTSLSQRVANKLRQVSTTEKTLEIIQKIKDGQWVENHLPLNQKIPLTNFLQARQQLINKNQDLLLIQHVIDSLANQDRSALFACAEWRPVANHLNLPNQPKKDDYPKK